MDSLRQQLDQDGFAVVRDVVDSDVVDQLKKAVELARSADNPLAVSNSSGVYGLRNLIDAVPAVADLVQVPGLIAVLGQLFDDPACLVRATLFDKTNGANWGVFWHQDLSIAVRKRLDVDGFAAWTRKAGVDCVQPPTAIMSQIRAVRIHLDDSGPEQGALRVLPGTHRLDRLAETDVQACQSKTQEVVCEARAGDAVIMCPLLLHASSPMTSGSHRRVIHLEFADFALPSQLEWFYSIPCPKAG